MTIDGLMPLAYRAMSVRTGWTVLIATAAVAYLCLWLGRKGELKERVAWPVMVGLVILSQLESWALGPLARVEWGDGGTLFLGYMPYLAKSAGSYLADLMGGVDRFALGRFGGEYVSLRVLAFTILPPWLVVVAMRFVVPFVAAAGVYLFLTRPVRLDRGSALALGFLFAVGWDFTATLTLLYGLSLAAFPMLGYMLLSWRGRVRDWIGFLAFGAVYVSTADPLYWLPNLGLFVLALAIWVRPASWRFLIVGLGLLCVAWIANFADVIFGIISFLPFSARTFIADTRPLLERLIGLVRWMINTRISYNTGGFLFAFLFAVSVLCAALRPSPRRILGLVALVALVALPPLSSAVPWARLGIAFLETYRWYSEYTAIVLVFLVAGGGAAVALHGAERRIFVCLVCGLSASYLVVQKARMLEAQSGRGNLSHVFDIPNLKQPDFPLGRGKVAVFPGPIDANSMPSYGLPTLQGAATLYHGDLATAWDYGVDRVTHDSAEREGMRMPFDAGDIFGCCGPLPVTPKMDVAGLRALGVGYMVSHRPLADPLLEQVSGPATYGGLTLSDMVARPARPAFVYAVRDPAPPAYMARHVDVTGADVSDRDLAGRLAQTVEQSAALLRPAAALVLGSATVAADVAPPTLTSGVDCFTLRVSGPGLAVVNIPYLPFWQAHDRATGAVLPIAPANIAQTAVAISGDTRIVDVEYRRPRVLDRFRPAARTTCAAN